ncbi:hypothetical protein COT97_02795 [Candidatus Falkowbacteria bacterium CG10_big_fil_rev_8_21_14_0_10_39_11]|uniref:Cation efflux protein transmembrane domain-containing protein n=1 Tax=Candidatus Falkowbacteria bacterium CG10_big_fil_rev_8_21_14_0_10_39_11 TaxID=1974565 RepID=A0A2H0V6U0_9BACT|nr:MAG: hypothetical protein COT97_02795 [Candidatus Falkowbacteria bacterium CG10_big_fil_rev_8_21_14_0_10_39_11]
MKNWRKHLLSPYVVMSIAAIAYIIKFCLKYGVGQWVNSPALIADGYHNFADLIEVGLVMFFGIYLGNKPRSAEYPMGRKRLESIIVLGIGIALVVLAYDTTTKSLSGLISLWPNLDESIRPHLPSFIFPPVENPIISESAFIGVLCAAGISAIISMIIGRYEIVCGKKAGMVSLIADGQETISDGKIEIAAFIGFLSKFGLIFLFGSTFPIAIPIIGGIIEYALGLFVAYLVIKTAWEILGNAFHVLLAKSIGTNKVETIRAIVKKIPGIRAVTDITSFSDGHTATCLISVETAASSKAHRPLWRTIKKQVKEYLSQFEEFMGQTVHVYFQQPEYPFMREAQALILDNDGREMNSPTIESATHMRIYDMDGEHHRLRAVDIKIKNLPLSEFIDLIQYKSIKSVFVFTGSDEERRSCEHVGIHYELNTLIRPYIHSRLNSAHL